MSKAAAATISPEDAPKVRKLITEILTAFDSHAKDLGEPFIGMSKDITVQYNSILEKLPGSATEDAGPGFSCFLSVLTSTQSLLTAMGSKLSELKARSSAAPAEDVINAAAEKVILARITAGTLIPAEKVTTLCSDAKAQGITEGENRVREELKQKEAAVKVIGQRKELLTTNSLPLPASDDLLGGTDAEFAARRTTAEARVGKLKEKGVALNSALMADVWGTEAEFGVVERVVSTYASASPGAAGNPFDKGTAGAAGAAAGGAAGSDKKVAIFAL